MKISKQVIIMRTDLRNISGHKIRTGKVIAQGAHASMKAVLDMMSSNTTYVSPTDTTEINFKALMLYNGSALKDWIDGKFTKICLSVDSEEELLEIVNKAQAAGLPVALITDAGLTEFDGVPTRTCCAIGPAWSDEIDLITSKLKLL